mgnify:CR=1 FL=1
MKCLLNAENNKLTQEIVILKDNVKDVNRKVSQILYIQWDEV